MSRIKKAKEHNGSLFLFIFFVVMVILCIVAVVHLVWQMQLDINADFHGRLYDLERELHIEGLTEDFWILGKIHSPPFLVKMESADEFLAKVREVQPQNIWIDDSWIYIGSGMKDARTYYIFSENGVTGYYYRIIKI